MRALFRKESLYRKAMRKLARDKVGLVGLAVVTLYLVIAIGVALGWWAANWDELYTEEAEGISKRFWFGTNWNGQDVFQRVVHSTKTAFEVGFIVSVCSAIIGAILGSIAGYYHGTWIDAVVIWIYTCIDCIPFYLFVAAVAFAMGDSPYAMHAAMIVAFWSATAKQVRGGVIKIKNLEYIEAARAIGVPRPIVIFRHVLPNTFHLVLIEATLAFVLAIKSEVILSFLGLGVKEGVSWGLMIAESTSGILAGHFNNFFASSGFMFFLVMGFNLFSDALQDALDPKTVA